MLLHMQLNESLSHVECHLTTSLFVNAVECMHAVSIMHVIHPPAEPKVDIAGIELATSCMLSMGAVNCAKGPLLHMANFLHSHFFLAYFVDAMGCIYQYGAYRKP
jgi:hypothetical protein